ncbi:MJ0548 connectase family domain-containing protein, partial [Methanocaldococcus sp.]
DILNDSVVGEREVKGFGIIIFSHSYIKKTLEDYLKSYYKILPVRRIDEIENILKEAYEKISWYPTLSKEYDVVKTDKEEKEFDKVVEKDLKSLFKYREELRKKLVDFGKVMNIVNRIVKNGEVGVVKEGKLYLYDGYIAIDKISPNPKTFKVIEIEGAEDGDIIVIKDGDMLIKGKNKKVNTNYIIIEQK